METRFSAAGTSDFDVGERPDRARAARTAWEWICRQNRPAAIAEPGLRKAQRTAASSADARVDQVKESPCQAS
jgi:hypothetical protein